MKDTDKVTLTVGQLKRLVKESTQKPSSSYEYPSTALKNVMNYAKLALTYYELDPKDKKADASVFVFNDAIKSLIYWADILKDEYHMK